MIFYSNNLEMRMLYFAHCVMLRYRILTSKVYFDGEKKKKNQKRRISFQLHLPWFAYIALLLPPKHAPRQAHTHTPTNERKTEKRKEKKRIYAEQQFKVLGKLPMSGSFSCLIWIFISWWSTYASWFSFREVILTCSRCFLGHRGNKPWDTHIVDSLKRQIKVYRRSCEHMVITEKWQELQLLMREIIPFPLIICGMRFVCI